MEFKSIDEYYREFINTDKESFYDFLEEKLQEAKEGENYELADHIAELQMDADNQEAYVKEMKRTEEESMPVQLEKENKEALLEELRNVTHYLAELENRMNVEDFHARYESFERDEMWRERRDYEERIEQIETLLAKEIKSKSVIDAGFEVNELGEIIRPSKPLGEISTEDLSKLEEEMDQEINANNEKIKQAQIDRLLAKQQIIREQRKTLKELEGQAVDFGD